MAPRRARISEENIEAEVRGDNALNFSSVYDAPFPIFSEQEGERYRELSTKIIEVPTYLDFEVLDQIELTDIFMTLCQRSRWDVLVRMNWPVYRELTLEFFTSLMFVGSKPTKLWFRLRGQVCFMDERILRDIFGLPENDIDDVHQSFNINSHWKYLTDLDDYDPHIASNAQIINAEMKLLHKFMCGVVFGKRQSTKCSRKELFLLWCIQHGHKPNIFTFVSRTVIELVGRRGNSLGMGYLATALAEWFRLDLTELNMLPNHFFDVPYLKRCEIIDSKTMQVRDPTTRSALKRRLGDVASRSRCDGREYGPETEGQQQQPPHPVGQQAKHEQQPHPDLGMVYQCMLDNQKLMLHNEELLLDNQKLMLDNYRNTQQQLDETKQQLEEIKQQMTYRNQHWVDLNQTVDYIATDLHYMERKMEKAWCVQGLNVPSPTPSPSDSPEDG